MTCLPDVNVWLALATERHQHHGAAAAWMGAMNGSTAVFCRVTQMGLLRLLTNRSVMGPDLLAPAEAWHVYEEMRRDGRVGFAMEPEAVEPAWKQRTRGIFAAGGAWSDAYLAAMADLLGAPLVTFDKSLAEAARGAVCLV